MHVLNTPARNNGSLNALVWLLLLFWLGASGCTSPREMADANSEPKSAWDDGLSFQYNDSIQAGTQLEVTLQNQADEVITLLHPYDIQIFSAKDDASRLRTLYCPCNASCVAPTDELVIPPHKSYTFRWRAIERWCETNQANHLLRIEKKQLPQPGEYFLLLHFRKGDSQKAKQILFTIYH